MQQCLLQSQQAVKGVAVLEANHKLLDPSDAGVSTLSAKVTGSQARGSRAAEKSDNSSEDDNDTHRRGVKQVIADFEW